MGDEQKEAFRSRIVGQAEVAPESLLANPKNWRMHPESQLRGLQAVLNRVGWVQPVIVNRRTGHLVDGHLRVTLAIRNQEPMVPVSYVDLSHEEEDLVLATLDPLAGMASTDRELLDSLLESSSGEDAEVQALLESIAQAEGLHLPPPPSMEELAGAFGEPEENAFWPVIKLKVPHEVADRFTALLARAPFVEDWRRLGWVVDQVGAEK